MDSRPAKSFIESVNTLRDLGLSDLDLPRVALVGMHDAKVDVLKAILGFATDNSRHGCPFEYRLSRGGSSWSCRISVRSISEDNIPLQAPSSRFIGDVITKKTKLPAMMKRAQIAALNPSISIPHILSMPPNEMDSYLTTNLLQACVHSTVCLEFNGTDLIDLTLIEMPDLDLSFEHETRRLLENIVLDQLQGKCIIVAAIPMNADIFSKRALYLARDVDPDGARTIGVLTNLTEQRTPDRPDFALQLGYYYITPQNDGAKAGEEKKAVEKSIAKALVSHGQDGTERLEATLSFLLAELIRETMPLLRVDVINCLDQYRQEIASLPPAVTEPATYMLVMLTRLSDDIHRTTRGSGEPSPLLEQIHGFYADLKLAIRKAAPNFVPVLRSSPVTREIINHLADDEGPCERAGLVLPFYLDDMRKHITAYATRDLLSRSPCQAKKALIESFQNQWAPLVSECLEQVVGSMVKVVIERIQVICQGHELLTEHLRSLLGELIRHHLNVCSEYLEAILEIELTPYTQQRLYLNSCSENWLSRYRDIRKGRIGTNQKSRDPTLASNNTTSTPSRQVQNVQSEATRPAMKLNESLPFKSRPSDIQAPPPSQGAENSAKNPTGQLPSALKTVPQDKLNTGLESSKVSATSDSKAAEVPKARAPNASTNNGLSSSPRPSEAPNASTNNGFSSSPRPPDAPKASTSFFSGSSEASKVPVNPAAFGLRQSSGTSNTAATSPLSFPVSSTAPSTKSTHSPSESKTPFATFGTTSVPKDSTSNTTPTVSSAFVPSTTSALSPFTSEGLVQKDLPFPIRPIWAESGKSAKAKTADESFKDSNPKVFPFKVTGIPNQPPTTGSTTSNADTECTSKNPDADYQIALSALSRLGFTGLTRADLEKLSMADEYEDELKLMADVRGYFQIASMRVVDYVPAFIGLKFVRAISSDILPFFMEKMGLGRPTANAICATYFAEDAEMAVKREGLSNIQMRLESAQLELYKLGV